MKMKKTTSMIILVLVTSLLGYAETSPIEKIKEARNKKAMKSVRTLVKMITNDATGAVKSTLVLEQMSAKDKNGRDRTLIDFRAPVQHRGTRFLMLEQADGSRDTHLYLPSLARVYRVKGQNDKNQHFMDTVLTYGDMNFLDRKPELDTYKEIKNEIIDGMACVLIQATAKDPHCEYPKYLIWLAKKDNHFVKVELYNKNAVPVKKLELRKFKRIDGHLTPFETKITDLQTKTTTTIYITKIKYNSTIPDRVFTISYLKRGR